MFPKYFDVLVSLSHFSFFILYLVLQPVAHFKLTAGFTVTTALGLSKCNKNRAEYYVLPVFNLENGKTQSRPKLV